MMFPPLESKHISAPLKMQQLSLEKKIKLCASCPKISHLRMYEDKLVYRAEKYACNLVTEERNCILHLLQMTS